MNKIFHFLLLGLLFSMASCDQKSLDYLDSGSDVSGKMVDVGVGVDWTNVEKKPEHMTVLAYSADGKHLHDTYTDSLEFARVKATLGYNTFGVVNDATNEFVTVGLRELGYWDQAEAYALPLPEKENWYSSVAKDAVVAMQPEKFMMASKDSVLVPEVYATDPESVADSVLVTLYPKDRVEKVAIKVRVKNLYRKCLMRGVVGGLAGGFDFSEQLPSTDEVCHQLEQDDWVVDFDDDLINGVVSNKFKTFGAPGKRDIKDGDYYLHLFFTFTEDGEWHDVIIEDIEDAIVRNDDNDGWIIDLSDGNIIDLGELGDADGDQEGGNNGSFDVDVNPWEEAK